MSGIIVIMKADSFIKFYSPIVVLENLMLYRYIAMTLLINSMDEGERRAAFLYLFCFTLLYTVFNTEHLYC